MSGGGDSGSFWGEGSGGHFCCCVQGSIDKGKPGLSKGCLEQGWVGHKVQTSMGQTTPRDSCGGAISPVRAGCANEQLLGACWGVVVCPAQRV